MPTEKKNPDVPHNEDVQDATYGGFEKRLSYDRIVKRIERKSKKKEEGAPAPDERPSGKKRLNALLFSLIFAAAAVVAIGLWLK